MTKQQFNYEVWKNHSERARIKLQTRNGSTVTEFTDAFFDKIRDDHGLLGVCDGDMLNWNLEGNFSRTGSESRLDLFMILPEEKEMYVPVFKVPDSVNKVKKIMALGLTDTKEESDNVGKALGVDDWEFIGTFKLVKQ